MSSLGRILVYGAFVVTACLARSTSFDHEHQRAPHGQLSASWAPDASNVSLPFYNYTYSEDVDEGADDKLYQVTTQPSDWKNFTDKGWTYWKRWEAETGADIPPPEPVNRLMRVIYFEKKKLQQATRRAIHFILGKSIEKTEYFTIRAEMINEDGEAEEGPDELPSGSALFQCTSSASQGILIVSEIHRGEMLPKKWHSSQVVWWMWERTVRRFNPNTPKAQRDYSNLHHIFQQWVTNSKARPILQYTMYMIEAKPERIYTFKPGDVLHPDLEMNAF